MSQLFIQIVNMSITASWLILAVVITRFLLKKAPKWLLCLLWVLVAFRLVCPFTLKSALSLIPSARTIPSNIELSPKPAIDSGITVINQVINPVIAGSFTPEPTASMNPLQLWVPAAAILWLSGIAIMLLYALISYLRLRKTVAASVPVKGNIKACDEIKTPFILGLFKPTIYVPSSMTGETLDYVIRHESAHLRRKDHWWKPLGFLLLAIYWFNPLCWLAYILLCRDIEMACDEKVIRDLDKEHMAAYSQALLDCSYTRKYVTACPLAFGEVGIKERIKGILHYKKPAFWIMIVAVIACIVLAVCLLTDPSSDSKQNDGHSDGQSIPDNSTNPDVHDDRMIMTAVITELQNGTMLVTPVEGSWELSSSNSFVIPMQYMAPSPEPQVGDTLEIEYNGYILETYPASLGEIYSVTIIQQAPTPITHLFMTQVAYANWTDDVRILENCLNQETLVLSNVRHLPVFKFETKAELDQFKTTFEDSLTFDHGYDEIVSFNDASAAYDNDFFGTYSIILAYVEATSGSFRYIVQDVMTDGSLMCLDVVQTNNPETYTEDMAGWFVWVEVEKSDLQKFTSFDARLIDSWDSSELQQLPGMIIFGSFSYQEVKDSLDLASPTVKTDGFVNTEPVENMNPVDRAKEEVTVVYNLIQTFYDEKEDVWMVHFWYSEQEGGDQIVYLDGSGVTLLIVYWE